ncbi:MAG: ornithine cyclodeaminase family protein [Actinomycetota bacterium]
MAPRFIGREELHGLLSMAEAIDALERAFGRELPYSPDRSHLDVGAGDLLLMPAWGDRTAGVKLVTVAPDNPSHGLPLIQGLYVLFEKPSLAPVALLDAAALTALRTAAVSGVATKHLARERASSLVIFGAGVQAAAHLEAMAVVRPIDEVQVVSRTPERSAALVRRAKEMGAQAGSAETAAVREADIVCTCTTSAYPVFEGSLLRAGAHVNAVGSYRPGARELDDEAIRVGRVFVDTTTALRESGDLLSPIEAGVLDPDGIGELAQVVRGEAGRASDPDITIFKSVGAAFEDLVVAAAAAERL